MPTELPKNWLDHIFDICWESDDSAASCRFVDQGGSPAGTDTFTLADLCKDYPHLAQGVRVARLVYTSDVDQLAALQHWSKYLQQPVGAPPLLGSSAIAREDQAAWFEDWSAVENAAGRPAVTLTITQPFGADNGIFDVQVPYDLFAANFPWARACLETATLLANSPQEAAATLKLEIREGSKEIEPLPLPEGTGLFSF